MLFVPEKAEIMVAKEGNAGYQHFPLLLSCCQQSKYKKIGVVFEILENVMGKN